MDTLAALCDILACTPDDLIEVTVAPAQVRTAAGGGSRAKHVEKTVERTAEKHVARTTIRRPDPQ